MSSVGDLNRDMSVDLAVGNYGENSVSVLMNNYAPLAYKQSIVGREDTPMDIVLIGTEGPLDYIIVKGPTNGTISSMYMVTNENGYVVVATNSIEGPVLHYVPNADGFGSDLIDYYVYDGIKTSKIARVSMKILSVNDQPSFKVANQIVEVREDAGQ
jgi:predicted Holliday junction resolvase-like endonuclease